MKLFILSSACSFITLLVGITLPVYPILAQSTPTNAIQDLQNQDTSRDPFSSRGNPTGGLYDLIHQAQMGSIRNLEDFRSDQQESLDEETIRFRAAQTERLKQSSPTPIPNPNSP